ncbi:uncharacterized protein BDW43DRAFT_316400 [Aspergillus alliaceus]|uniref:uncharacterized protein n=1 Tax=Petromyces alliaceus TaxID=209559 RepID=UPI0012A4AB11|nr:uncharacterized protein BDW43DRAFT_316400 [Aspergillus alliaceus]KAB8227888.1 hypothetical protein BDW43DRAFT_316400 [Aspergillus alliaceus]
MVTLSQNLDLKSSTSPEKDGNLAAQPNLTKRRSFGNSISTSRGTIMSPMGSTHRIPENEGNHTLLQKATKCSFAEKMIVSAVSHPITGSSNLILTASALTYWKPPHSTPFAHIGVSPVSVARHSGIQTDNTFIGSPSVETSSGASGMKRRSIFIAIGVVSAAVCLFVLLFEWSRRRNKRKGIIWIGYPQNMSSQPRDPGRSHFSVDSSPAP